MRVFTTGHGTRPGAELIELVAGAGVQTLVDVRRFPGSRRNPQFNATPLAAALAEAGIGYRHAVELGGRLDGEPGEARFACCAARPCGAMRRGWSAQPGSRRSRPRWPTRHPA